MEDFLKKLDRYIDELEDKNDYQILSYVVDEIGSLPDYIISHIAKKLNTFEFSLEGTIDFFPKLKKSRTKYYVQVCTGKGCYIPGLKEKLEELRDEVDFPIDERHCLGKCSKESNLIVGDKYYKYKTLEELEDIILNLK